MRIAFYGKGGSGKTTLAAAFTKYSAKKENHVLAIDADINAHLQETLGFAEEPIKLGENHGEVIEFLKDRDTPIIPSSPPKDTAYFSQVDKEDEFIQKYAVQGENISVMTTGSFDHEDHLGGGCFHGKLEPVAMFLNHLLDTGEDTVVADVTAGTDNLGTPMYFAYDLNLLVIEPTIKSVEFYKDFSNAIESKGLETLVIGNKIESEGDKEFIRERVDEEILGFVERSQDIKRYEQGEYEAFENFVEANSKVLGEVRERLKSLDKDWNNYQQNLKEIHVKTCKSWYNDYHSMDLTKQSEDMVNYVNKVNQNG